MAIEMRVAICEVVVIDEMARPIVIVKMEVIGVPVQLNVRRMQMSWLRRHRCGWRRRRIRLGQCPTRHGQYSSCQK